MGVTPAARAFAHEEYLIAFLTFGATFGFTVGVAVGAASDGVAETVGEVSVIGLIPAVTA